eukprot:gene1189-705_t
MSSRPTSSSSAAVGPRDEGQQPPKSEAWAIQFGPAGAPKTRRKMSKKEREALMGAHRASASTPGKELDGSKEVNPSDTGADSEGNRVAMTTALPMMKVDGLEDRSALIPTHLTTTRAQLEQRLCLRVPRLLCVNKQYPRSCGVSSLASVYNYLYSCIGESSVGAHRAPLSQEEIMSTLGFEPPFGDIPWGPFTGNSTLIRWFHALNRHYGLAGRAYVLYKVHGKGQTSRQYPTQQDALEAVKAALRDPHCALIYHCYNHYMVPVGYQDIPAAQVDFLQPQVSPDNCDTTVFIGDVSRGKHEALYARRWKDIVKDLSCALPEYFNIRRPELGIQIKQQKKRKQKQPEQDSDENTPIDAPTPPPVKAKRKRNLHCLICFRNDQIEEHPERYEDGPGDSTASDSDAGTDNDDSSRSYYRNHSTPLLSPSRCTTATVFLHRRLSLPPPPLPESPGSPEPPASQKEKVADPFDPVVPPEGQPTGRRVAMFGRTLLFLLTIVGGITVGTMLISWSCAVEVYNSSMCSQPVRFRSHHQPSSLAHQRPTQVDNYPRRRFLRHDHRVVGASDRRYTALTAAGERCDWCAPTPARSFLL